MVKVLIAGGGTGGHVFPMVAVGDALRKERDDVEVTYVGTGRGIEARVVPERGDTLELLDVLPLRGRGLRGFVKGAVRALSVLPRARMLVRRLQPDVVFSVGGYAAGPVTLAARSLGVPVTLLEPNAVLGFTNKLLSKFVQRAYVCFPELRSVFAEDVVRWTGVPLRKRFEPQPYAGPGKSMRLLVMGGSQGALAINEAVPAAVARCLRQGIDLKVVHQTGRNKDELVRALYQKHGILERVEVRTFISDVAAALGQADVVIERSGAASLAELTAVGRPALLIPYPYAADDHQRFNAESLANDGAAICINQQDATSERLATELQRLAEDEGLRIRMAAAASRRGRPDAAGDVARDLLALAGARSLGGREKLKSLAEAGELRDMQRALPAAGASVAKAKHGGFESWNIEAQG